MKYPYSKPFRLKTTRQYRAVLQKGPQLAGKFLVLSAFQNSKNSCTQFGVIASRHYGKSTVRNRFKRISREAFRSLRASLPTGMQLVVRPRKYALEASMKEIFDELKLLCEKILEKN